MLNLRIGNSNRGTRHEEQVMRLDSDPLPKFLFFAFFKQKCPHVFISEPFHTKSSPILNSKREATVGNRFDPTLLLLEIFHSPFYKFLLEGNVINEKRHTLFSPLPVYGS